MLLSLVRTNISISSPAGTAELDLKNASVQQPPFPCNDPLLVCHPERSRGTCGAPFVCPAPTGPQPPSIITVLTETPTSPLSFRVSRSGPRNRRSLGFARDDKKGEGRCKERAVAEPRHLSNLIWTGLSSAVPTGLDSYSAARTAAVNALVPLVPPTSRVSVFFSMYTFSRADCTRSAVPVSPI